MQWINSRQGYGWLAIALHWLAAIAVIYLLWSGFEIDEAAEAGDRALHHALEEQHISFGMTVILVLAARVVSSYVQPRLTPPEQSPLLKFAALATHQLLLLAIILEIVTGPLLEWSHGHAIQVWDWFSVPGPFDGRNRGLHETLETLHGIARWPIVILIALHVLGALKHAMIDRDGVLKRMLVAKA